MSYTLVIAAFVAMLLVPGVARAIEAGDAVDVALSGQQQRWDEEGRDLGVLWEDARDVFRVVVRFKDAVPAPDTVHIEYWASSWPHRRIPRDELSGAGSSGWLDVGDWFQGEWVKADAVVQAEGMALAYTFNPVNKAEFTDLDDFDATYRSTLKIRIVGDTALPEIVSFETYTDSVWQPLAFEVIWKDAVSQARLEAFNGVIADASASAHGVRATVWRTATDACNSFDETVVTVRNGDDTFSFSAWDLAHNGHLFLPDFGALVRTADSAVEHADPRIARDLARLDDEALPDFGALFRRADAAAQYADAESAWQGCRDACVYERVKAMPEQTFPRAWNDMPAKGRFYIPISFEGSRQHFGVDPNGSVFCRYNWLRQIRGNDTDRCLYDGDSIRYTFGLSEGDLVDRSRVDGCLPMIGAVWTRDGVRYRQTAFAVPLAGVPEEGGAVRADDTIVLMIRFEMSSLDGADHEAHLEFAVYDDAKEALTTDGEYVFVADTDPPRLRLRIAPQGQDLCALRAEDGRILYAASVSGDVATRVVDVAVPYITFTTLGEWHALRALDYDVAFDAVKAYWTARLDEGTQIATPEPMVNEFYRAHTAHLLLNTEREVGDSERYVAKVGTFSYGAFSNESCMMVSDLDRRGYAKRAEQALETWLHYQGAVPLPGDFSNTDGQFYGAGGYEHGGYNQHHGFVLWCLGEHYWYTRDRAWLEHAAPHIVRGCDWIVHERARTIAEAESNPLRAIERGLLPPGYLEDIRDWRSWLSTNVYSWWGMHNAAAALADAGLPDGARLVDEAEAYRRDILDAFMQATRRSPVIQLRDGGWVPHVPAEVHRRGRTFGWITETLEGGIHMIRTGLIEPNDPLATWIIKDYEDNLYISKQYGYEMSDDEFEQYWFSRGGISMQANLLCNPIPYLLRDEPEHFLRAYFNAFAASYFPDTRMMTEHALPKLGDWRGDHYKSSDEANSTYWLRLMFLEERGDKLRVGAAVPRYWLASKEPIGVTNAQTYFGPASVTYEADPDGKRINLCLDPPRRNPPRIIYARFRHPDKKRMIACEVDGKAYDRFDADEEWVMLTDCGGSVTVSAIYE